MFLKQFSPIIIFVLLMFLKSDVFLRKGKSITPAFQLLDFSAIPSGLRSSELVILQGAGAQSKI